MRPTRDPSGQALPLRALGRLGAWFGMCERTPSGAWRLVRAAPDDPWDPSRHLAAGWIWAGWCWPGWWPW